MSEHLHPDIDSLNAFVEGVLQEHERVECLAHLAECPRCRELGFLAQEPPSVAVMPRPAISWRRWFAPIPVLTAAAVICIALTGMWLYLRRPRMEASTRDVARVTQPRPQSPDNRVEAPIPEPSVARKMTLSARTRRKSAPSAEQRPPVIAALPSIQPPPEVSIPGPAPPPLRSSLPQPQPSPSLTY